MAHDAAVLAVTIKKKKPQRGCVLCDLRGLNAWKLSTPGKQVRPIGGNDG
jgi:hypothetical protein